MIKSSNLSKLVYSIFLVMLLASCGGDNNRSRSTPPVAGENDLDLRDIEPEDGLIRLYGSVGQGNRGVPVAGGVDMNGDGFNDFAKASMMASPEGRTVAGQVFLALGNGELNYTLDSGEESINLLTIIGDGNREMTGSEIWMDDITGDGLAELMIARQNYSTDTEIGVGALSIIFGSDEITDLAMAINEVLDLRDPPANIEVLTIVGENALDRLGMWMRAGDVTGDGINDLLVAADQSDAQGTDSGAAYLIRGGDYLNTTATIALDSVAGSILEGQLAKILPPTGSDNYHLGATLNVADLDGNGLCELMLAATVNRAGASEEADGAAEGTAVSRSGYPLGRLFIVWDDNFAAVWPSDYSITIGETNTGTLTDIRGAVTSAFSNDRFGEEILGGLDYDGDGTADLFVGDITGSPAGKLRGGLGFVFFNAELLKDQDFDLTAIPLSIETTTIYGTIAGAISSDTALHGDFDNDGIDDLAVSSPHDAALDRDEAGSLHVLWGQSTWPSEIQLNTSLQPDYDEFAITDIYGANGSSGNDIGDVLAYSASAGDINNDGYIDLIVNEMLGNGAQPNSEDVGNLIVISGSYLQILK